MATDDSRSADVLRTELSRLYEAAGKPATDEVARACGLDEATVRQVLVGAGPKTPWHLRVIAMYLSRGNNELVERLAGLWNEAYIPSEVPDLSDTAPGDVVLQAEELNTAERHYLDRYDGPSGGYGLGGGGGYHPARPVGLIPVADRGSDSATLQEKPTPRFARSDLTAFECRTSSRLHNHYLPQRYFDALATGGGQEEIVDFVRGTERSWRLGMFYLMRRAVSATSVSIGPLVPVETAWQLLDRAYRASPRTVDKILMYPGVGAWLGLILARLYRPDSGDDPPLWVELGHLHTVAAAAAIQSGLSFSIKVPVRDSRVVLPTLGEAVFPTNGQWSLAEITSEDGRTAIREGVEVVEMPASGVGDGGWSPCSLIAASSPGRAFEISLDDQGFYGDPYGCMIPHRLTPTSRERWQTVLQAAWELLARVDRERSLAIARGLSCIVPLARTERHRPRSASMDDAFGGAAMSEPYDPTQLAVTLVHEFQHNKLGALMHMLPLYDATADGLFYAPWRDDPRPIGGLLHGLYAFVGVADFWRRLRRHQDLDCADLAQFEFALWRDAIAVVLRTLQGHRDLSDRGREMVDALTLTTAPWDDEPVPTRLLTLANIASKDHAMRWRAHHLEPSPSVTARLAQAWLDGANRPPALDLGSPQLRVDGSARWCDSLAVTIRTLITERRLFAKARHEPGVIAGASSAEVAYIAGEVGLAQRLYLAELAADPYKVGSWTGLGWTLQDGSSALPPEVIRGRPELLPAVQRKIVEATGAVAPPLQLATWVSSS